MATSRSMAVFEVKIQSAATITNIASAVVRPNEKLTSQNPTRLIRWAELYASNNDQI